MKPKNKQKALSPLIATILLVVVSVILVLVFLNWGKEFTTTNIDQTNSIVKETNKVYMVDNLKLNAQGYLSFKNITPENKPITIIGYQIISSSVSDNFNQTIDLDETTIPVGGIYILSLPEFPPEDKFTILLITDEKEYVSIENIQNIPEECQDPPSSENFITSFKINNVAGDVNDDTNTISLVLPAGTDLSNLSPEIVISEEAKIYPSSGIIQNFNNPVTYIVTAENRKEREYTVVVTSPSSENDITSFKINNISGTINNGDNTILINLPAGTDLSTLTPIIGISAKATISPASGISQNFNNFVSYTVTAESGETRKYTVTATVPSSENYITSFIINGISGIINNNNNTVYLKMPVGTNLSSLTPIITISEKATISPASGVSRNFNSPVTYTVTAESGATRIYTVTVEREEIYSVTLSPGTIVNDNSVGYFIWQNPEDAKISDNLYAIATLGSDFGPNINDSVVKIIKSDGTIGSENKAKTNASWPTFNKDIVIYGDDGDLWSEEWLPENINNSNFGVLLNAKIDASDGTNISNYLKATNFNFNIPETATIDGIKISIEQKTSWIGGLQFEYNTFYANVDSISITVYYRN